jgi:polo-like kinase 1
LGRGGFAKCYEITNIETKKVLAAKIITKASLNRSRAKQKVPHILMQLISEIKIHKSLHHQNIVQFEHVFEDHENVYILLELCSNQVTILLYTDQATQTIDRDLGAELSRADY